jgi:hypothetical protein
VAMIEKGLDETFDTLQAVAYTEPNDVQKVCLSSAKRLGLALSTAL